MVSVCKLTGCLSLLSVNGESSKFHADTLCDSCQGRGTSEVTLNPSACACVQKDVIFFLYLFSWLHLGRGQRICRFNFMSKKTNKIADLQLTSQLRVNRLIPDAKAHHLMARLTGFYAVFYESVQVMCFRCNDNFACLSQWFCNTAPLGRFGGCHRVYVNPASYYPLQVYGSKVNLGSGVNSKWLLLVKGGTSVAALPHLRLDAGIDHPTSATVKSFTVCAVTLRPSVSTTSDLSARMSIPTFVCFCNLAASLACSYPTHGPKEKQRRGENLDFLQSKHHTWSRRLFEFATVRSVLRL